MATAPNEDGQYVWLLTPPDPAPAAERRAWDRLFKNGSLFERRDIDVNDPLTSPSMVPSFPRDDNVDLAPAPLPPPHHDDSSAPIHTSELETPSSQQEPSSRDRGRTSETVPGGIYRHAGGPRTPSALIGQRGGDTEITLGHLLEPDPTPLPSQGRAYDLQLYTARISMMHKLTGTLAHTLKRQEVPGIYRRLVLDTGKQKAT
ncbi:hypothetical protein BV20DRAFT_730898 [Pilatotrama ljubarskyi]|nr:hypothetical protein BV20DRAFT_730898 [Pilatotrama ljubarskyi]